jgi:hypothetical protein
MHMSDNNQNPRVHSGSIKTLFLTLALFCAGPALGTEEQYLSASAAYRAYCRIYERNDAAALAVYSDDGVIRLLDEKSGRSKALPMGMYKNLIRSMIPGAQVKGEHVDFSDQPEQAQTGGFYTWRGSRTTYPAATTTRYIVDIKKSYDGSYRVVREVLLTWSAPAQLGGVLRRAADSNDGRASQQHISN